MNYFLNEGSLQLPSDSIFDGTINVIRFDKLNTSLVITRGRLNDGESLEHHFEGQIKNLEAKMKEVKFQGRSALKLGPNLEVPAIETRVQYKDGKNHIFQFQLLFELVGRRVVAMSYVKNSAMTEKEAQQWDFLKSSIDFK